MEAIARRRWSIWIDTGGTFTDCVAVDPSGAVHRVKVLSSGAVRGRVAERLSPTRLSLELPWPVPEGFLVGWALRPLVGDRRRLTVTGQDGSRVELSGPAGVERGTEIELASDQEAAVLAARLVTGTPGAGALPEMDLRLATTRGTNALLERQGAEVALFVTRGFADLLEIGNQQRPDLFALEIVKALPLYRQVVEVDERLTADGTVLRPLSLDGLRATIAELLAGGVRAAAVSLLHGYRNGDHERRVGEFLRQAGFEHVTVSSELAPLIRYLPRTETAVVNAYLAPVIGSYVEAVRASLGVADLKLMTSAGGLVAADRFRPKDSLLSGPAGGVVGAAGAGRRSGFDRVIAFDMGGTSTDVSRFDGEYDYRFETRVGAARLLAPALAIETVAAGGGSICRFDGIQPKVGPQSAGADPGPACYGAGGPLTVTDVNLLLGRLLADRFEIPIDRTRAGDRAAEVLEAVRAGGDAELTLETLLAGFLQIANERMAEAVRRISVREGYAPAEYALVAFGGAGAQHGCALAELLGMERVVVPRDAGLLSTLGLGHAVVERFRERQVLAPLDEVESRLEPWLDELTEDARRALVAEGVEAGSVQVRLRRVHLRLLGQDSTLAVDHLPGRDLRTAFDRAYREVYGYLPEARPVEVESLRVVAGSPPPALAAWGAADRPGRARGSVSSPDPSGETRSFFGGRWLGAPVFERAGLEPGQSLAGPALVSERHSATVVEPGWTAMADSAEALVLTRETGDD